MFTPKTLSFLRSLKRNNKREWFHERKDQYETHCRGPMIAIVERLADDLPAFAPDLVADPKVSLFRPVPRHAVQRRQDAAEDAHRRDVSESHARPHERRRSLLRSRADVGVDRRRALARRIPRSCTWSASTSPPTIGGFDAIVKSPGFKKLGGLQGDTHDARAARVREGSSRGRVPDAPAVLGFREEPAAFADVAAISTSSCCGR